TVSPGATSCCGEDRAFALTQHPLADVLHIDARHPGHPGGVNRDDVETAEALDDEKAFEAVNRLDLEVANAAAVDVGDAVRLQRIDHEIGDLSRRGQLHAEADVVVGRVVNVHGGLVRAGAQRRGR